MRWTARAPVTWPASSELDREWQQLWSTLRRSHVADDGRVVGPGPEELTSGDRVELTAGRHLEPGAEYRIAPDLTTGVLQGWISPDRVLGAIWRPHAEAGTVRVEVVGLDRISAVRARSTLAVVHGTLRVDLSHPVDLLELEGSVPWLRLLLEARVRAGHLEVVLDVRGRGPWWPTLAPVLRGASRWIGTEVQRATEELAAAASSDGFATIDPRTADLHRVSALVATTTTAIVRRQQQVEPQFSALPWYRRTRRAWRRELARLGPTPAPTEDGKAAWRTGLDAGSARRWHRIEQRLADRLVALRSRRAEQMGAVLADFERAELDLARRSVEATHDAVEEAGRAATPGPVLTDAAFDVEWLRSPRAVIAHLRAATRHQAGGPSDPDPV